MEIFVFEMLKFNMLEIMPIECLFSLLKYLNIKWSISPKLSNFYRIVHIISLLYF